MKHNDVAYVPVPASAKPQPVVVCTGDPCCPSGAPAAGTATNVYANGADPEVELPGSLMVNVTPVTGCADAQPAAAAVELAAGWIVIRDALPTTHAGMSYDTMVVTVGVVDAPALQYWRTSWYCDPTF